jgi:hypothetical protein
MDFDSSCFQLVNYAVLNPNKPIKEHCKDSRQNIND